MGRRLWTRPRAALLAVLVVGLLPLVTPEARAAEPRAVPVPTVEAVPEDAGLRRAPHRPHFTAIPGYVEQEYFISGTAKSYGAATEDAAYKTRIYVVRPADAADFNGTVLVEWNNVTGQIDSSPVWYVAHEYLIREGYAFVGVAAQKAGHEPGPLALKPHDPVRYGSLDHPGDDYSFDMFSQAGQAVLSPEHDVLGDLTPERLIATGQSQSGSRLGSYLRNVHRYALRSEGGERVFDGVMPMTAGTGYNPANATWTPIPDDLGPVFWVNSQNESGSIQQPDGGDFRLIEIAGAPHFSWWGLLAGVATGNRNDFGVEGIWNRESAGQSGERGGGPCPRGFFPDRYAYAAAIDHMNEWLVTGEAPKSWPRIDRVAGTTTLATDRHGNVTGGFRLPAVDVPVARYTACALFGQTVPLAPDVIAELYPTHQAYVDAVTAAVDAAIADGTVLPDDRAEIVRRAEESQIGTVPPTVAVP